MKKQQSRRVLVLDGQGGGMGAQLIRLLAPVLPQDCVLRCVGTNVLATNAMLKAGRRKGRPVKMPLSTMPPARI